MKAHYLGMARLLKKAEEFMQFTVRNQLKTSFDRVFYVNQVDSLRKGNGVRHGTKTQNCLQDCKIRQLKKCNFQMEVTCTGSNQTEQRVGTDKFNLDKYVKQGEN